jgi:type II secretory ATPase GspE/PulE/Tfp pilus assembly ATPase PilB-like protein
MVGEIRDKETANIAVQAALTGHLMLSSLHTNDAPTAIPRLVDMGIPPFLAAAVLNTISAQRLARRIHVDCIESYAPEPGVIETIKNTLKEISLDSETYPIPKIFFRGKGCATCNGSGYYGRIGLFEILDVNEKIRKAITDQNFNLDTLRNLAREQGMVSIFEDGLRKVQQGMTTVDELFRVIRE